MTPMLVLMVRAMSYYNLPNLHVFNLHESQIHQMDFEARYRLMLILFYCCCCCFFKPAFLGTMSA